MPIRFQHAALLLAAVCGTVRLASQDPRPEGRRLTGRLPVTAFEPRDFGGHPQSTSIAQTADGLIHVGNPKGLFTYDGERWSRFSHPRQIRFSSLAAAENGDLFVGLDGDFGLVSTDSAGQLQFTSWSDALDIETLSISQIVAVPGAVYFSGAGQLIRVDVDGSTPTGSSKQWSDSKPSFLPGRAHGRIFHWARGKGLRSIEGDALTPVEARGLPANALPLHCFERDDGEVLFVTHRAGLLLLKDGAVRRPDWEVNGLDLRVLGATTVGDKLALATMSRGLVLCDHAGAIANVIDQSSGLPVSSCFGVPCADREGAVWVPLRFGVARVACSGQIESFGEPKGLRSGIGGIARHAGTLFVCNPEGLHRLDPGDSLGEPARIVQTELREPCYEVIAVGGDLLVGTQKGVLVRRGSETRQQLLPKERVYGLVPESASRCYAWSSRAVFGLVREGRSWRLDQTIVTPTAERVDQIITDPVDGARHIHGRAMNSEPFQLCSDPSKPPMTGGVGRFIAYIPWRGSLWLTFEGGVFRRPQDSTELVRDQAWEAALGAVGAIGFPHVVDDRQLWIVHNRPTGVASVRWDDGPVLERPFAELYPDPPYALHTDEDGSFWLGTGRGKLYRYRRADRPPPQPTAMRTLIRDVTLGGEIVDRGRPSFEHSSAILRLDFALPSFDAAEQSRFRTRLVGLEEDWQPWSGETHREFTALREGEYRFEVQARDVHGTLADPAALTFAVRPPWHRSTWAYIGYAVVLALLGLGFANWRVRRSKRRFDALEHAYSLLRESEERFRTLVETTKDLVWATDAEFRITYVNPRFCEFLGVAQPDVLGTSLLDFIAEEDRTRAAALLEKAGRNESFFPGDRWRLRGANGEMRTVDSSIVPIFSDERDLRGFRGIDRDVSERDLLERQLRQAQKLEAVGQLAGGIAHDFNNLLTVFYGQTSILSRTLADGNPDATANVREIERTTERGARLTRKLLAFSRNASSEPKVVSPNGIINGLQEMLSRLLRDDIELRCALDTDAGHILIDPCSLEQVLVNLAVNAADAMPAGGTLTIETAASPADGASADSAQARVTLRVIDTGVGMDSETLDRIFEPFFTTKDVHRGTGLGLAMVHGIVETSGGRIHARSVVGEGTVFTMDWPRTECPEDAAEPAQPRQARGGDESVLVCDDDDAVRRITCAVLESAGYAVTGVEDSAAAIQLVEDPATRFDILVTDVVMPGLTGTELARSVTALDPKIRVLYVSGYLPTEAEGAEPPQDIPHLLSKPFQSNELLESVRVTLDQRGAPAP